MAAFNQLFRIFPVQHFPFALTVRSESSISETNSFIRKDSAPFQGFNDVLFSAGNKTVGVSVFDAKKEIAVVLLCKKVCIQSRANSADMQRARRAWSKTCPN